MNLLILSNSGHAAGQDALPMEFLEFLGEGILIEDEYLDPLNYADIEQDEMTRNKINQPTEIQPKEYQPKENQAEEVKNNEE